MSVSSYQGKGRTRHSTVAKMRHLTALAALTTAPSAAVVVGTSPDGTALLAPNPNGRATANTRRADEILGKATAWQMLALRRHPSDMLRSQISQNLPDAAGFQAQQRSGGDLSSTSHLPRRGRLTNSKSDKHIWWDHSAHSNYVLPVAERELISVG